MGLDVLISQNVTISLGFTCEKGGGGRGISAISNPDWDITHAHQLATKSIFVILIQWLWLPYSQRIVPRHPTHGPWSLSTIINSTGNNKIKKKKKRKKKKENQCYCIDFISSVNITRK